MKKHPTLTSIIIAFFRTALLLVLLLAIIISTTSVFLRNSIFNKELFTQQITSNQYISEVTEFIDRTIKRKCMAYKLPYNDFRPIITDIRIRDIAERYANNLYESLINGTPMEDICYPSDDIFKYLKEYLQNKRIMVSDDDVKFFAEDIAHDITVNIVAINESYGGVNLIKPLSRYIFNNVFLRTIAEYSDLLVVACAFLTIITWILCSANFKSGLFNVASIYWLAGLFMFVPVMYFENHNVLNGVSIGDTPVKSLINVLAPPIIDSLTSATMTVFITAGVIMLYTIVLYIVSHFVTRKKVTEDIFEEYTDDYTEEYSEVYPIETAPCDIEENVRVRLYFPVLNPPNDTDKAPDIINSDTAEDTDTVEEITTDDVTDLIVDTDHNDTAEDTDTVEEITTDDVKELIVDTDHSGTAEDTDTVEKITTDDVTELIVDTDHSDTAEDTDTVEEITTDDVTDLIVDTDHSDTAEDIDTVEEITTDDVTELINSIDNDDTPEDTSTVENNTPDDLDELIGSIDNDDTPEDTSTVENNTPDDLDELIGSIDNDDTPEDTSTVENNTPDDLDELIGSIDNDDTPEDTSTVEYSTSDDIMKIIADVENKLNY